MSKLLKQYASLLGAVAVAAAMIIASLLGYENAWWVLLAIYAVLSALVILAQQARKNKTK